ncbi:sialic acid-binding Ig-like lectin 13 isoform 3-T3 [Liasis olivaceus]
MKPSSKYLPLTFLLVLCDSPISATWNSTLPSSIQALEGSCVVIPCSFTFPDSWDLQESSFSVSWYQYHSWTYPEIYNSKTPSSVLQKYQGRTKVVGDLEKGNCTLSINPVQMEDAMRYYVWINPDSVWHRFYDVTVQVEVTDAPNQLELSDLGLVTEGDPTQVSCSVLHTCPLSPPVLTWNLAEDKAVTIQEHLAGGSWRTESSFNYIPSHRDHGRYLQCSATFPNRQQIHSRINLNVQYKPVIWPESNCTISRTGETVTCYCVAEGNPPPRIEWYFPNHTVPGDFNSSKLWATLNSGEQTIIGILRGPGSNFTHLSCKAINQHGTSQITLPTFKAGNVPLLLIGFGGAVAGLLLFTLLGILIYKVTVNRRKKKRQGEEEENRRIHGNGEQIIYLNTDKPSKDNEEEQLNMYSKSNVPGGQDSDNELSTSKTYENMEKAEDYENISTEKATEYYGISDWQFPCGSDQFYSNI